MRMKKVQAQSNRRRNELLRAAKIRQLPKKKTKMPTLIKTMMTKKKMLVNSKMMTMMSLAMDKRSRLGIETKENKLVKARKSLKAEAASVETQAAAGKTMATTRMNLKMMMKITWKVHVERKKLIHKIIISLCKKSQLIPLRKNEHGLKFRKNMMPNRMLLRR